LFLLPPFLERGIIWEECIIMLPPDIQCVFLSATLSNAQEFAEWVHEIKSTPRAAAMAAASAPTTGDGGGEVASAIASLAGIGSAASARPMPTSMSAAVHHRATCHVVYTNTRPIPLRHYGFLKGGAGIYQIKTDKVLKKAAEDSAAAAAAAAAGAAPQNNSGTILTANIGKLYSEMVRLEKSKADEKSAFSDLIKAQASRSGSGAGGASSAGGASNVQAIHAQLSQARAAKRSHVPDVVRLVSLCVEQQWLPALFFSFSRRECEGLSLTAVGDKWKLDLTSPEEKECVRMVWARAMEGLDKDDRQLKPLQYMYPLLLRGFAVHHSGLLPLLKEVVEILFQEGLVRVLFCTETFAMGLNMPARCVVFSSLSKFDGRGTRYLQASEYIQMAGRAGRRGQDSKGIVICMLDKEDLEAPAADQSPDEQSQQIGPDGKPVPRLGGMLRHLLMGSTDPLQSKFRLTYNMILNLIRCSSSFDPAFILSQSFLHFQQKNPYHRHGEGQTVRRGRAALGQATKPLTSVSAKRARMGEGGVAPEAVEAAGSGGAQRHSEALASVAELQEDLADFDKQIADLPLTKEQQDHVVAYQKEYAQLQAAQLQLHEYMLRHPTRCLLPFLQSGRLVFVATPAVAATNTTAAAESRAAQEGVVWGWGIVLNWRVRHAPMRMEASSAASAINASSSLAAAIAAMEDTEEAATGPVPVVAEVQPRGHELDDADDEAPASPSASPIPVGASPPSTPLPASAPATAPVLDRTPSQQQQQASPAAAAYQAPRFHPAEYVVDVLLPVRGTEDGALDLQRWGDVMIPQARQGPHGPQGWLNGEWDLTRPSGRELRRAGTSVPGPPHHIVSCSLRMLQSVSAVRVYLPPDLRLSSPQAVEMRSAMFVVLDRATDNFAHRNLPKISLDDFPAPSIEAGAQPPADSDEGRMNARAEAKATALSETLSKLEASLSSSPVHDYSLTAVQEFLKLHVARSEVHGRLASLSGALGTSHLLSYRVELATRLRILRRFRHLTSSGVITAKGRIAADIECADELLLTEFIYEGHWTRLDESELLAVLTCWLDVERSSAAKLTPPTQSLRDAYARVRELAQTLASASSECGLLLDSARYVASFKPDLLAIMHAWLSDPSLSFAQLASMSDLFEGTLIRLARRLDELVNQLRKAAQAIGEKMLDERLAKGQARLKRGIMFAGSLYI
jgi:superfamily II RNA helicase